MSFTGTDSYVATEDLMVAVNAAVTLQRPLLIKGSPVPARPCWRRKWPTRWGAADPVACQIHHQSPAWPV